MNFAVLLKSSVAWLADVVTFLASEQARLINESQRSPQGLYCVRYLAKYNFLFLLGVS
jgi:hypothetical protein